MRWLRLCKSHFSFVYDIIPFSFLSNIIPFSFFEILFELTRRSSCIIAFQNIVPISLYISIEIVKTIQAYFISQDVEMYYQGYDTPCVPKTWNISDDLGQIE
jgi:magnesium-transporting ATPase (P-type)